ncbi:MAG TPA: zinc ribbon domain-containing protein [Solirubrobacterales bacterium]|jgi:hypothetical protein
MSSSALQIPVCTACGHAAFPPHLACSRCGSREWRGDGNTAGTVEQTTFVRRRVGVPADAPPIPLASVRSDLGPVVIARAEGGVGPGDRVTMAFDGAAVVARPEDGAA